MVITNFGACLKIQDVTVKSQLRLCKIHHMKNTATNNCFMESSYFLNMSKVHLESNDQIRKCYEQAGSG